ncbi:TIR domain-containing protein [Myroides ceti]|uniref:TIR domain-containing protein n=1 Tax=Paenimyroides ceti TaxID=395087 RepID=A0ABT8CRI4_9FLAO|nr:TIR domain-containing protein [Paenimyroides ceti]MDN3706283.1 TIR domain-containing protein [Paenimyroides ceti]
MARKVFVSYKYKDDLVADLRKTKIVIVNGELELVSRKTIARDYVDKLQLKIGKDNINLGEKDGESLVDFSDGHIETSLKRKIRQCSITIVLISKGMKTSDPENEQWVPWEVSYSLRTIPTGGNTKQMNAILGIVLPDETGSYDWYFDYKADCNCTTNYTGKLFKILKDNTFNIIDKKFRKCGGRQIYINDEPSFFKTVKWNDFMNGNNYNNYLEKAIEIKNNKDAYDVHINLD